MIRLIVLAFVLSVVGCSDSPKPGKTKNNPGQVNDGKSATEKQNQERLDRLEQLERDRQTREDNERKAIEKARKEELARLNIEAQELREKEERLKRMEQAYAGLNDNEKTLALNISHALSDESCKRPLNKDERSLLRRQWDDLFYTEVARNGTHRIIRKHHSFDRFCENIKIRPEQRTRELALAYYFALDRAGIPGSDFALSTSDRIKDIGLANLTATELDFIKQHQKLFFTVRLK